MTDIISPKRIVRKKTVSFKVNEDTAAALEALKKRAKAASHQVDFRLDDVIDEQLVKLIAKANQQLDRLDTSA